MYVYRLIYRASRDFEYLQAKQSLQQEKEALQKELRELNLKVIDIVKACPDVAAWLNNNSSVNVSPIAPQRTIINLKSDNMKAETHNSSHKLPDSDAEGKVIYGHDHMLLITAATCMSFNC